jgi:hypothetical protein
MGEFRGLLVSLLLVALLLPGLASSRPDGVGREANDGCLCHTYADATKVVLSGLPEAYEGNTSYNLTLTVSGTVDPVENRSQGGFRMVISNGTLTFNTTLMQMMEGGLTHTEAGSNHRSWTVVWTSPEDNASRTTFTVHGNVVNGNLANTGDAWSTLEVVLPGVEHTGDLQPNDGLDGVDALDRALLVAGLLVLGALLWHSVRP